MVLRSCCMRQVADDPEAATVLAEVRARWRGLSPPARARVHLACLPLTSPEENDVMVNAIQRLAAVVVKKSLQEGFGLGVTEALWKGRPVVASTDLVGDNDALTGLWNRRRFEQELDRSRQHGERIALLSIDVDAFRDVIHRQGERAAEELIGSISHALRRFALYEAKVAGGDRAILHESSPDA